MSLSVKLVSDIKLSPRRPQSCMHRGPCTAQWPQACVYTHALACITITSASACTFVTYTQDYIYTPQGKSRQEVRRGFGFSDFLIFCLVLDGDGPGMFKFVFVKPFGRDARTRRFGRRQLPTFFSISPVGCRDPSTPPHMCRSRLMSDRVWRLLPDLPKRD